MFVSKKRFEELEDYIIKLEKNVKELAREKVDREDYKSQFTRFRDKVAEDRLRFDVLLDYLKLEMEISEPLSREERIKIVKKVKGEKGEERTMKLNKLQNINLSKYKLAYFSGDSFSSNTLCQDKIMALEDNGKSNETFNLVIALIPKDKNLTECGGDDWDDKSATDNASGFYRYPLGTIFLKGQLGGELKLMDNDWT